MEVSKKLDDATRFHNLFGTRYCNIFMSAILRELMIV
jgi:hypothetical protein